MGIAIAILSILFITWGAPLSGEPRDYLPGPFRQARHYLKEFCDQFREFHLQEHSYHRDCLGQRGGARPGNFKRFLKPFRQANVYLELF